MNLRRNFSKITAIQLSGFLFIIFSKYASSVFHCFQLNILKYYQLLQVYSKIYILYGIILSKKRKLKEWKILFIIILYNFLFIIILYNFLFIIIL